MKISIILKLLKLDISEPYQIYFQNGATTIYSHILYLHDYIQYYLLVITIVITWLLIIIIKEYLKHKTMKENIALKDYNHQSGIEIIWTVIPAIILILLAIPSFSILYSIESTHNSVLTIKVLGSQWYWSYEITDMIFGYLFKNQYESYMIPTKDLELGQLRLMETDNMILLPINKLIRVCITSTDVIHSWSVPSLGVKMDAIPGRLNQVSLFINKPGIYYGACQEICGIQHAFMPIKIYATNYYNYINSILLSSL